MTVHKPLSQQEQDAYQRWELDHLEGHLATRMPTADDIERIRQQGYREGYEAGVREGMAAGYQQGEAQVLAETARMQAEVVRMQAEAARMQELMIATQQALQQLEQGVGQELLGLALDLTKQMLRQALKVKPEIVLSLIRGVMDSIPQHMQHPHLYLHPEDAALVRFSMQAELPPVGWKVIDDHRIERGGCRIETSVSEVDATLPARWQKLAAALGQDVSWLDE